MSNTRCSVEEPTQCPYDAVNGTDLCLEHAEEIPEWAKGSSYSGVYRNSYDPGMGAS